MKELNIISVVQAQSNLTAEQCKKYYNYLGITPKSTEINDLDVLIKQIELVNKDIKIFDNFYFGYTIPQIGKEFDLLRFGNNYTINIELKSIDTGGKIFKQLERNEYYLSFLTEKIYCFTFVTNSNKLYSLDSRGTIIERTVNELIQLLYHQDVNNLVEIDKLFNPSNYLVSPFNSTLKFIYGEYFLTQQQEIIKKAVNLEINKSNASFVSICGKAGTGKTLLTYDIGKDFINNNRKVLIIHCGILNEGHTKLINDYKWDIISIRNLNVESLSNYDLIIIDETQRIYPTQLDKIIEAVKSINNSCVFSYDKQQCLRSWETNNKIDERIQITTSAFVHELTLKIRTNKEIASFINCLFDKSKVLPKIEMTNIELSYFNNTTDSKRFISKLVSDDWKVINYTPSTKFNHPYDEFKLALADSTHEVIGQEFDKVVVVIDSYFYYNGDNLSAKNNGNSYYYNPPQMLFQMMTRVRKKLKIVVIDNPEIMDRCLSIIS